MHYIYESDSSVKKGKKVNKKTETREIFNVGVDVIPAL